MLLGGVKGIRKWNEIREKRSFFPDLSYVDFSGAWLTLGPDMRIPRSSRLGMHATLGANLQGLQLHGANFEGAILPGVSLKFAEIWDANFSGALLDGVDLDYACSEDANFARSKFHRTTFCSNIFKAKGLEEVIHAGPSAITVSSLRDSKVSLPEKFLRGCGLREEEITYFRSQVGKCPRFYSCFISYCLADEGIATRLHNDLQAAGIRCWKWNEDAKTGRSLWREIDQAIRVHDKLVLIASESSLKSPAVNREIERAIRQEDDRGEDVLFPVRVDNYIFDGWEHERKADVVAKVIADASDWENDNTRYEEVRDRLIRDLRTDTPKDA